MATTMALDVRPVTTRIGAVVDGVDLTRPLDRQSVATIRQAVLDHGVAFLRGQVITREQMAEFMANFGTLVPDPMAVEQKVKPVELDHRHSDAGLSRGDGRLAHRFHACRNAVEHDRAAPDRAALDRRRYLLGGYAFGL